MIGGKVLVRSRCSQFVSVELPAPQIRGLATVALAGGAQRHAQQASVWNASVLQSASEVFAEHKQTRLSSGVSDGARFHFCYSLHASAR